MRDRKPERTCPIRAVRPSPTGAILFSLAAAATVAELIGLQFRR